MNTDSNLASVTFILYSFILYIYLSGVLKTGLPEILSQVQHIARNLSKRNRARLLPPLGQLIFFEGGFRQTKCPVVAQTQGYHLVCIWGSLVKFQGGGVVLKTMLCARVRIC